MTTSATRVTPRRAPTPARAAATQRSGTRRRGPDAAPARFYVLAASVALLVLLGLIMVLSASSVTAMRGGLSSWSYFLRQAPWALLGAVALYGAYRLPDRVVRAAIGPLLVFALALNTAVLVPGLGVEANGSRAWLSLGPVVFQPSELLKLAVLLYSAQLLTVRVSLMHDVRATFGPLVGVLVASGGLLLAQHDLGSAVVVACIVFCVGFIAGLPLAPFAVATGGFLLLGSAFVMSEPYRRDRWLAFLDLTHHREDAGYQVWQSLIGIASGGLPGVGLGASRAKWGYLPESHTDFIFAITAEELGLIGVTAVIGLYLVVLFGGITTALGCRDRFRQLVAGGLTAWISVQALINMGGVVGVLPLTGLTLPFMSYGRSSLLVMLVAAGLLLNIARRPA